MSDLLVNVYYQADGSVLLCILDNTHGKAPD